MSGKIHEQRSKIGKRYNSLVVLEKFIRPTHRKKSIWYLCQCDCGGICEFHSDRLSLAGGAKSCGCKNIDEMIGQEFGKLTVISENGRLNKGRAYLCDCDCGEKVTVRSSHLKNDITKSCGCAQYDKSHCREPDRRKFLLLKEYENMLRRNRVELNFSESDISFNDFRYLSSLNCYYCGSPPSNQTKDGYEGHFTTDYILTWSGLDRKNSSAGYIKSNVVPSCGICNVMKGNRSVEDFDMFCKRIKDHQSWG